MTDCPSLAELIVYLNAADPAIDEHVSLCRRCRALLRLIEDRGASVGDSLGMRDLPQARVPQREAPAGEIGFGEVCILESEFSEGALLVAVVVGRDDATPEVLTVAPVSTETTNATDWDLLLEGADSSLGYAAMLEIWNEGTILSDQIVERLGLLAVDGQHRLRAMHEALLADEEPPANVPHGVPVLVDADPRAIFQEEEAERTRPFWQPAGRAFAEAPATSLTIGQVFNRWLEREGYEPADYATEIGWSKQDVVLVVDDEFTPATFPSDRLAEAFRRTDIASEEIEAALWQTIQPQHFESTAVVERRAAFRRTAGRRGAQRGTWRQRRVEATSLPPVDLERLRKRYINEVLEALEEGRGF